MAADSSAADFTARPAAVSLRAAAESDFAAIAAIYADAVRTGLATFETEPPSADELARRWREVTGKGLPWLVAACDGDVAGYAYAAPYRARTAYRYTLENSVYVARSAQRCGIGRRLLDELVAQCAARGYRQMVAVIGDSDNAASIELHRACGFSHTGTLAAVGFKFGRWVDTVLMQRALGEGGRTLPSGQT